MLPQICLLLFGKMSLLPVLPDLHLLPVLPDLHILPVLPDLDPATIQPSLIFPISSLPTTIPAFPEQSDIVGVACTLNLPDDLTVSVATMPSPLVAFLLPLLLGPRRLLHCPRCAPPAPAICPRRARNER